MSKKLVIITGASSGMGAAAAVEFHTARYPVLLLARRIEPMTDLKLEGAMCRAVDIRDTGAVRSAVEEAVEHHGPADLLVNNAGIMPMGSVADQPAEDVRNTFEVNVLAAMEVTRIVLPSMVSRRGGTIMNVGSIAGHSVYDNLAAYCGSKFGLHAMSEQLRREMSEHGVRVVVIAPGIVDTALIEGTPEGSLRSDYLENKARIGGGLEAEHVAQTMRYAYELPQEVCARELIIAPTAQAS